MGQQRSKQSVLVNTLIDYLGQPSLCPDLTKTIQGVTFIHRKKGSSDVWAFIKKDSENVEKLIKKT